MGFILLGILSTFLPVNNFWVISIKKVGKLYIGKLLTNSGDYDILIIYH